MGSRVLLWVVGDHSTRILHDRPRLLAFRHNYRHHRLVKRLAFTFSHTKCLYSRLISNRLLLSPPSHSTPADSRVEWAYAFDVHTNAFFPLYLTLYLAQLFLLPIIYKDNWVCLWVGNTLYLAAYVYLSLLHAVDCLTMYGGRFSQYTYGIYLGLNGQSSPHRGTVETVDHRPNSTTVPRPDRVITISPSSPFYGLHNIPSWVQRCQKCPGSLFQVVAVSRDAVH